MTLRGILKPHKIPKDDLKAVQSIFDKIESRPERYELNLYISGQDETEPDELDLVGVVSDVPAESAVAAVPVADGGADAEKGSES